MNSDNITRTGAFRDVLTKADFEHIYLDFFEISSNITGLQSSQVVGKIPFVNASGANKPVNLTIDNKVPFQKQNGTTSNFSLII